MRIDCVITCFPLSVRVVRSFLRPKGSMNRFAERRLMRDHSHASTPSLALSDCSAAGT